MGVWKATGQDGFSAIEVDGARVVEGRPITCWVCRQILYLATVNVLSIAVVAIGSGCFHLFFGRAL
jgi:hypothetical protein